MMPVAVGGLLSVLVSFLDVKNGRFCLLILLHLAGRSCPSTANLGKVVLLNPNRVYCCIHAFYFLLAETPGVSIKHVVQTIAAHKLFGIVV